MNRRWVMYGLVILVVAVMVVFAGPTIVQSLSPQTEPASGQLGEQAGIANPASAFCIERGFKLEIRTGQDGGQHGVCVFPDGSECDEWAFFRGECGPK